MDKTNNSSVRKLLITILAILVGALIMDNYWDNKWAKGKLHWETRRAKSNNSEEILAGLKKTPGGLGRARPNIVKELLDAGYNNGRSATITATGANTQVETAPLVELKGDDEKARTIALTLQTNTISSAAIADVFAKIEWGSGGFQSQAEVDILRGVVLNLNCSWLRVTAGLEGQIGDVVKFGAFASYGYRGSTRPPQRTAFRDVDGNILGIIPPATSSGRIRVPDFANSVMLVAATPLGATDNTAYSLRFLEDAGGTLYESWFVSPTGSNAGYKSGIPIPLSSYCTSIRIINREAAGGQNLVVPKLIFGLGI